MPSSRPAVSETGDPLLLTPGPLTTSKSVKEVMVHDWGSGDAAFIGIAQQSSIFSGYGAPRPGLTTVGNLVGE